MGSNDVRLCGNNIPQHHTQLSDAGLHITYCSDNTVTAKGFLLMAKVLSDSVPVSTSDVNKREITLCEVGYNYIN